jgi:hypothetical protein
MLMLSTRKIRVNFFKDVLIVYGSVLLYQRLTCRKFLVRGRWWWRTIHLVVLKATLLGVNLDKKFSNVLDGLIWVDATQTDPRLLRRVMGQEGFALYTAHHRSALPAAV